MFVFSTNAGTPGRRVSVLFCFTYLFDLFVRQGACCASRLPLALPRFWFFWFSARRKLELKGPWFSSQPAPACTQNQSLARLSLGALTRAIAPKQVTRQEHVVKASTCTHSFQNIQQLLRRGAEKVAGFATNFCKRN